MRLFLWVSGYPREVSSPLQSLQISPDCRATLSGRPGAFFSLRAREGEVARYSRLSVEARLVAGAHLHAAAIFSRMASHPPRRKVAS